MVGVHPHYYTTGLGYNIPKGGFSCRISGCHQTITPSPGPTVDAPLGEFTSFDLRSHLREPAGGKWDFFGGKALNFFVCVGGGGKYM